MSDPVTGGQGVTDLFRVDRQSDGSLRVSKADGSAAAALPTDRVHRLEDIESTQHGPQDDGTYQITLTHADMTPAFIRNVLNVFAKATAASGAGPTPAPFYTERGVQKGSSSSSDMMLLALSYGNDDPVDGSECLVHAAVITLTKSSGGFTIKRGEWIRPGTVGKSVAPSADVTLVEEIFDSAIVKTGAGGIGDQVIEANTHYFRDYLTKAA